MKKCVDKTFFLLRTSINNNKTTNDKIALKEIYKIHTYVHVVKSKHRITFQNQNIEEISLRLKIFKFNGSIFVTLKVKRKI